MAALVESWYFPAAHVTVLPPHNVTSASQQFIHVAWLAVLVLHVALPRVALNLYPAAQLPAMAPKGRTMSKATTILKAISQVLLIRKVSSAAISKLGFALA